MGRNIVVLFLCMHSVPDWLICVYVSARQSRSWWVCQGCIHNMYVSSTTSTRVQTAMHVCVCSVLQVLCWHANSAFVYTSIKLFVQAAVLNHICFL